ncbi:hypothetical protein ACFL6L_02570 [candidate division KSB1 bacterium]
MDSLAADFKDKGVIYYNLYTKEPHPGSDSRRRDPETGERVDDPRYDWRNVPQTKTMDEREAYALKMIKDFNQHRPIVIDIFPDEEKGIKTVQQWLGGGAPNSGVIIDREGKLVYYEQWAKPANMRAKLDEMIKAEVIK